MLHRVRRLIAATVIVGAGFLAGMPGAGAVAVAQAAEVSLHFDEIDSFMHARSPGARIIDHEVAAVVAGRAQALAWSNPGLAWDRAQSDEHREWQITLHKRFDRPFSQSGLREGWSRRVESAELRARQATEDLLAGLKSGYVRLRLHGVHLDRLERLAEVVDLAAGVADSRYEVGELSGAERQLIRLTAFSIDTATMGIRQERRRFEAAWRAELGIPAEAGMTLLTPVTYQAFDVGEAAASAATLAERPGLRSRATLALALGSQAKAARPGLVPGIDLVGGYKHFAPEVDGFVVGVGLDLPVFDRNTGAAAVLEAERRIVEDDLAAALIRSEAEIAALITAVEEAGNALDGVAGGFDEDPPLSDTLLVSYREGALTLDALLGAVQIETAALDSYYGQLVAYYENLFRLEAATGVTIVRFAR